MAKAAKAKPTKDRRGRRPLSKRDIYRRMRSAPAITFAWWIALPTVLVYVAVCILMFVTLTMMTDEINRIEADREQKAVTAAFEGFLVSLGESASDEGTWDEAYLNSYVQFSPAWLDSTWASTARIGHSYDNVVVTDATGNILFGEDGTGSLKGVIADHFSGAAEMLVDLDQRAATDGDAAVVTNFARNDTGIAGLSAVIIHRSASGELPVPADKRLILWLARHVTPAALGEISQRFQMAPLFLSEAPGIDQQIVTLKDVTGAALGNVSWQPSRPGTTAYVHAVALGSLCLLVIGAFTFLVLRGFGRSIVSQGRVAAENWRLARYDPGTGLFNRFGFVEHLDLKPKRPEPGSRVAVAHIGIEDIEELSDLNRRDALQALSNLFKSALADGGAAARLAVGQFALGFTGKEARTTAQLHADEIVAVSKSPVRVGDQEVQVKLKVHVADAEAGPGAAESATRQAEAAAHPRTTADSMSDELRRRRERMAAQVRTAIDKDEFDLDYQPIFDFGTQSVIAVEALLRWKRGAESDLGPLEFIDAAQSSGLSDELGLLMLRRAAKEIGPFPGLALCLNVATAQFRNRNLVEQISATLAAVRFDASRLQLEVPEILLRDYPDLANRTVAQLAERKITVTLDDFGRDDPELAPMLEFGIARIKLDRSIVSGIDADPARRALVQRTLEAATAAGIRVTAKGVERREEAAILASLGCREFQGYLLARPMPLDALRRLLEPALAERKAG